jgi:signal transduction histidine kinase
MTVARDPSVPRQTWPIAVLAAALVASGFAVSRGRSVLPLAALVLGLAMYFAASRLSRRVSIPAAAAAGAALSAVLVYAALVVHAQGLAAADIEAGLPVGAAWFIGDAVAARRRYLAGLADQAQRERAAEAERARREIREERIRIARELHDVLAHTLAVMTVQAGVGRRLMAKRPEEASSALESIETIGRTAQDELRVVLGLLRDEELGAADLAPVPRLTDVKELADTVQASGTPVELRMTGTDRQLSLALELTIYRVVQEALTNVVKHAPGASARVSVTVSGASIRVEVADDGNLAAGPGRAPAPAGLGIVGMRERIVAFGGWLTAGRSADGQFRVLAEIPVEAAP